MTRLIPRSTVDIRSFLCYPQKRQATLVLTDVSGIGLKNQQGNEHGMSDPSSWQDLLKDIISNPVEREQLAKAVGVRSITLYRWVSSESSPRPHNLRQLLAALPYEQRNRMAALLEQEHLDFSESSLSDSLDQLEFPFVRQVLELRATTSDVVLFWTLCHKVFQHALRRLDPERIGMSIRVVLCMPPGSDGKIHSLRESVGQGTRGSGHPALARRPGTRGDLSGCRVTGGLCRDLVSARSGAEPGERELPAPCLPG